MQTIIKQTHVKKIAEKKKNVANDCHLQDSKKEVRRNGGSHALSLKHPRDLWLM